MMRWFVEKVLRPRWIVNGGGELGLRILGVNVCYYKYDTPIYYDANGECGPWRYALKREFGECVISQYGFVHD